ncbi:hypothetical protein OTU49_003074 [Cherax quadricarinatus]|uniref:Uncharacterized protein n=2 Tax=Cherax quadricarinatus TaxID=27406 RepID=A0AAW0XIH1_CHEQU|nr:uncharacterized protein LOC128693743 isoform X2 [Cherax quadricarinatus]
MATVLWTSLAALFISLAHARLVFPPGTDMGYIVPDDPGPRKFEDDTNWLNEIDADVYDQPVLQRGEREILNDIESALWKTVEDRARQEEARSAGEDETDVQVEPIENWHGRWFPHPPEELTRKGNIPADLPDYLKDDKHGVVMGIPSSMCDNGKVNLTVDWNFSPINYTCFDPKHHRIPVQDSLPSVEKCVYVPQNYTPEHICMNREIMYNTSLPTFGPHRPIWPVFGEYKFVPVQRWLHNIEHGAVVMLYDPCTEPLVVHRLRKLVTGCIRKHIITPYTFLSKERPLALIAWGCSLEMSTVDEKEVKTFIKKYGLHGPEGNYTKDGGYKEGLIRKAKYPPGSGEKDSNLCPS